MTIDCHLKLDGIQGESTHTKHKDQILITGFNISIHNESNSMGGGMGKGKATPGDLHFTMAYCKASPVLFKHCAAGTHVKEGIVYMSKSAGGQEDFIKITMKEVFISSINTSASTGGEVIESVSLSYSDIEYAYKEQKLDGSLKGEVKAGMNFRENTNR
jgi:type VI secretion system secreted protein Hcp